jgi:hypothetical protein
MTGSALALLIALLPAPERVSEKLPSYDIEKTCRRAQEQESVTPGLYDACVRDQSSARDQAAQVWARAKPAARAQCGTKNSASAYNGYVDLLTCLQLAEGIVLQPTDPK